MTLLFLLACNNPPAPVPVEEPKPTEAESSPMVMTIFHDQYRETGLELDEDFTLWAWSGASKDSSNYVHWTREDAPKFTDREDTLQVLLTPEDLDVNKFGHPWVDFNVSMHDGTVWLDSGCHGFQLGETPNLWLRLYEQVDHKGNCRAYINEAEPVGSDKDHWIFFTHAKP